MDKHNDFRAKRRIRVLGGTLGLAVVAATIAFLFSDTFRIGTIEVTGTNVDVQVDTRQLMRNIFFFPVDATEKRIKTDNPLIETVHITKKYPDTLLIAVTVKKPYAVLKTGGVTYGIDETSIVTGDAATAQGLPVIAVDVPLVRVGATVNDPKVKTALAFIIRMADSLPVSEVTSYDALSLKARWQNTEIFIAQDADVVSVSDTLQTLFEGFRIKGIMPKTVDVRFTKPVVHF